MLRPLLILIALAGAAQAEAPTERAERKRANPTGELSEARSNLKKATAAARSARAKCIERLERSKAHRARVAARDAAEETLLEARKNGSAEERLEASAAFNRARQAVEKSIALALRKDPAVSKTEVAVVEAQQRVSTLAARAEASSDAREQSPRSGPPAAGERTAFVLDASGSMIHHFWDVQQEVVKAVKGLKPDQEFAVFVTRDGKVNVFAKGWTPRTDASVNEFVTFIDKVTVAGKSALQVAVLDALSLKPDVLWIATDGDTPDPGAELAAITRANAKVGARINTISRFAAPAPELAAAATRHLRAIAANNGGICLGPDGTPLDDPQKPAEPQAVKADEEQPAKPDESEKPRAGTSIFSEPERADE